MTTIYIYGSTPAQFNVGRLTGITRNSQTVAYTYDRFGRLLQDGSLTYGYRATSPTVSRRAPCSTESGGTLPSA